MNKEERVKLVFETISKIVGFEIKPNKDFYIWSNGDKIKYHIRSDLTLMLESTKGGYERSMLTILPILNGGYKLEEIKEPLTAEEERDFLRHFKFEGLSINEESQSTMLYMYNKDNVIVNAIKLNGTNLNFDGLEEGKKYSGKELGL